MLVGSGCRRRLHSGSPSLPRGSNSYGAWPPRLARRQIKKSTWNGRWKRFLAVLLAEDRDAIISEGFDNLLDEASGAKAELVAKVQAKLKRVLPGLEELPRDYLIKKIEAAVPGLKTHFKADPPSEGESFESYMTRQRLGGSHDWHGALVNGVARGCLERDDVDVVWLVLLKTLLKKPDWAMILQRRRAAGTGSV